MIQAGQSLHSAGLRVSTVQGDDQGVIIFCAERIRHMKDIASFQAIEFHLCSMMCRLTVNTKKNKKKNSDYGKEYDCFLHVLPHISLVNCAEETSTLID